MAFFVVEMCMADGDNQYAVAVGRDEQEAANNFQGALFRRTDNLAQAVKGYTLHVPVIKANVTVY